MNKRERWLEIKNVEAWRGDARVFKDLNVDLYKGINTAIIGPNGSGKSSFLKLISRDLYPIVKPRATIKLFGSETINLLEIRSKIGFVSSDLIQSTFNNILVEDFINSGFFGSLQMNLPRKITELEAKRTDEVLEKLGLKYLSKVNLGALSEGQKRLTIIARSLIHKPQILILDEPTISLDIKAKYQFLSILKRLCMGSVTIVLITHNIDTIFDNIERVILLKQCKVVGDGNPQKVLTSSNLSDLFNIDLNVYRSNNFWHAIPK